MPEMSLTIFKAESLPRTQYHLQEQAWSASGSSVELACFRTQLESHNGLQSISCDG